ncbi:MAG: nucleotidyltransferase [Clostridia bacterium]|nr:nucleotidyltransferase [Clostridia bacterium]
MGNSLGIIAEYNPFHNGHKYQLEQSKSISNADTVVCIMSGNFTQRGMPAITDKWSRAQMALANGVDIVIELPTIYSVASAESFAYGSIKILDSLGVESVAFGSECGNIDILQEIANVLYEEPKEYVTLLKHELSKGISFPKARENAILIYLNDIRRYANILSNPNNILGIEYLKAIMELDSSIFPITIERIEASHNSLNTSNNFASSTAIRDIILKEKDFTPYMPEESYAILNNCIKFGKIINGLAPFEKEIIYILRRMSTAEIAKLPDVSEGLENKIKEAANECNTVKELINIVKSKRYTETRIQRVLIYALLGITKQKITELYKINPYVRVLGMNKKGKEFVSLTKYNNPKLQFITSVKDFMEENKNKQLTDMLLLDILATNIYTLSYDNEPYANLDYTKKLVIM